MFLNPRKVILQQWISPFGQTAFYSADCMKQSHLCPFPRELEKSLLWPLVKLLWLTHYCAVLFRWLLTILTLLSVCSLGQEFQIVGEKCHQYCWKLRLSAQVLSRKKQEKSIKLIFYALAISRPKIEASVILWALLWTKYDYSYTIDPNKNNLLVE